MSAVCPAPPGTKRTSSAGDSASVRQDRDLRVGHHRLARLPQEVHLGAREAVEHLERAGEIELREPRVQQHSDVNGHDFLLVGTESVPPAALAGSPFLIHFLPMAARVIMVGFEGAQGLDVFGPAEVFGAVGRLDLGPAYEVILASAGGSAIRATSGLTVATRDLARMRRRPTDTVLVVGGEEAAIRAALACAPLVQFVANASRGGSARSARGRSSSRAPGCSTGGARPRTGRRATSLRRTAPPCASIATRSSCTRGGSGRRPA
jgi:hypothetical protein